MIVPAITLRILPPTDGYITFRDPILITKTGNDKAVGIAYAIASRIAGEASAGLRDHSDVKGLRCAFCHRVGLTIAPVKL